MTDFEIQVLGELNMLKAQMHHLLGIGQPGRLHQLELRVESHEQSAQRLKGVVGAFGALLTVVQVAIAYISERHR